MALTVKYRPVNSMKHFFYFILSFAGVVRHGRGEKAGEGIHPRRAIQYGGERQDPLLNHQIKAPYTRDFFAHFHKDGEYRARGCLDQLPQATRKLDGWLRSPDASLELQFGHVMGNHHDEPVLLNKTAFSGSIGIDSAAKPRLQSEKACGVGREHDQARLQHHSQ